MSKTERLGLILSPREKEALRRLAEVDGGLTQSALVRRLIRIEAQRRGIWPIPRIQGEREEVRGA